MASEMSKLELETKMSKAEMVSKEYHISDILAALTGNAIAEAGSNGKDEAQEDKKQPADVLDILNEVVGAVESK
jgi:hypothetical protein